MGWKMILLCVVTLIIMARWCSARSGMQVKIRGSHKPSRIKKINSIWRNCSSKTHREKMRRGYCDERAPPTYRKTVQLHLSKLGFFLTVLGNGTIHGVNYTYCQQNDRCKFELQACDTSVVRIKHQQTGLYVAMHKGGKVYTTLKHFQSSTLFIQEMTHTGWVVFKSERAYRKGKCMFLALRKNGDAKRSALSNKYSQFMEL